MKEAKANIKTKVNEQQQSSQKAKSLCKNRGEWDGKDTFRKVSLSLQHWVLCREN